MNPWAHGRINNESSYDLNLVKTTLFGTDQYRWNKQPPDKIPAKTQMNDVYDAMSNTLLGGYVSIGAVYEASVDGFVVTITFGIRQMTIRREYQVVQITRFQKTRY